MSYVVGVRYFFIAQCETLHYKVCLLFLTLLVQL